MPQLMMRLLTIFGQQRLCRQRCWAQDLRASPLPMCRGIYVPTFSDCTEKAFHQIGSCSMFWRQMLHGHLLKGPNHAMQTCG